MESTDRAATPRNPDCTIWIVLEAFMASSGNSTGPFIVWRNPKACRSDRRTSRVTENYYEVRQQVESGRWALIAVFTVLHRAA